MNVIIDYDLNQLEGEYLLQTHSTNPLLRAETIDKAIEKYFEGLEEFDSLFGVTKVQTRFYDKDANPINHNPEELLRTQDLEPLYEENSNFYIFSKESFENNIKIYPNPVTDVLNVTVQNKNSTIHIYNSISVEVKRFDNVDSSIRIPVSDMKTGLYFLTVEDQSGVQGKVKFIKK